MLSSMPAFFGLSSRVDTSAHTLRDEIEEWEGGCFTMLRVDGTKGHVENQLNFTWQLEEDPVVEPCGKC